MRFVNHTGAEEDDELFVEYEWQDQVVPKITKSSNDDGEIVDNCDDVALLNDSSVADAI